MSIFYTPNLNMFLISLRKVQNMLSRDFVEISHHQQNMPTAYSFTRSSMNKANTAISKDVAGIKPKYSQIYNDTVAGGKDISNLIEINSILGVENFVKNKTDFFSYIALKRDGQYLACLLLNPITGNIICADKELDTAIYNQHKLNHHHNKDLPQDYLLSIAVSPKAMLNAQCMADITKHRVYSMPNVIIQAAYLCANQLDTLIMTKEEYENIISTSGVSLILNLSRVPMQEKGDLVILGNHAY